MINEYSLGTILLGILTLLLCVAILRIAWKVGLQWNSPTKEYQKKMADIQRRKKELGIEDENSQ